MICMKELELSLKQANALLKSFFSLEDVYKESSIKEGTTKEQEKHWALKSDCMDVVKCV